MIRLITHNSSSLIRWMVFFLLPIVSVSSQVNCKIFDNISGDHQALIELYEATEGDKWTSNKGWLNGNPSSSWYGVKTDNQGRVVSLDLADNNLVGQLPHSIGNLRELRYINLKQNRLVGEIPSSIGNWVNIQWLLLSGGVKDPDTNPQRADHPGKNDESGNNFSGIFPNVWSNFSKLKYLELSGSSLTRIFYDSIGECRELLQVHVNWNTSLNQELPSTLNNLTKLQKLYLRANALTGNLPSLSNLTDLRFLHVGNGNALSGPIPDFSNNTRLREIILDEQKLNGGGFTGDWPHYWNNGHFGNLIGIRAAHNKITGTLHGFENLNLKTFNVDNNNIQGIIPESITLNNRLIILGLGWNNFSGQVPQNGWGNHRNTRYIRLQDNNLEGRIPNKLPNSSDLKYLYFQGNKLSGKISVNHIKYADSKSYPQFEYMAIGDNDFSPSDYQVLLEKLGSSKLRVESRNK